MPLKKLYTPLNRQEAQLISDRLAEDHIPCKILGGGLSSALGELPFNEVRPVLWVEEEDFDRAQEKLSRYLRSLKVVQKEWDCQNCGESVDGNLGECWNCGRDRQTT